MTEKRTDTEAIHGFFIVDDIASDTVPESSGPKNDKLVVNIEDETTTTAGDDVIDVERASEKYLEESEEKINLFDVLSEKEESEKDVKEILHNSTLIITNDEHLDTTTCDDTLNTSTETVKNAKVSANDTSINVDSSFEEPKKTPKSNAKAEQHGYFWVSNISRHVKAADLKKFFSQVGKVMTAKILTNGKNYYGYISVESAEIAGKCIKQLNNAQFDGKKITVSKDRPDLREAKATPKLEPKRKRNDKPDVKKEDKEFKVATEEKRDSKKQGREDDDAKENNSIFALQLKLTKTQSEAIKYQFKVIEYQRRHEGMRKKCEKLEKELKEMQYNSRAERRRLNQDREQFEKTKKLESIRLEADKATVNKELAEVKKLRETLKAKLEEMRVHSKKVVKVRSRSPPPVARSRSPRLRSPPARVGYRPESRVEKKRKREDLRSRTPPPPPKLNNGMGKKRGGNAPHRQYFEDVEKRLEHGHNYEYRRKPSFAPTQEATRAPWQPSYPKDPRRLPAAPSSGQTYSAEPRYGGGYQFPPSTITVPPRSYYPEFGKPYGHY